MQNILKKISDTFPELSQVEELIKSKFTTDAPILCEISNYSLSTGGKRFRPLLTLLTAKALGSKEISQDLIKISAGIELIHMATILHDDIIDKSPVRRHKPAPPVKYGNDLTLLAGDFLLTRAFGLCGELAQEIVKETEKACISLVEGEALEVPLDEIDHDINSSLFIAEKKTASLFQLSTFCAAFLSNQSNDEISDLQDFGKNLGIAFQIIDDILDVISTEKELGKRPGTDIIERKPSVINVLWLKSGSKLAQSLRDSNAELSDEYVANSLKEIKTSPVLDEARALALDYVSKAEKVLEVRLKGSIYKDYLKGILKFTTERMV